MRPRGWWAADGSQERGGDGSRGEERQPRCAGPTAEALAEQAQSGATAPAAGDEDGGPLDAVLLQKLLPLLPCPHRHHPCSSVWYLILNAVVLLILLSALADPDHYHFSSSELGGDFEFMDDANMCIAIAILFS